MSTTSTKMSIQECLLGQGYSSNTQAHKSGGTQVVEERTFHHHYYKLCHNSIIELVVVVVHMGDWERQKDGGTSRVKGTTLWVLFSPSTFL